ncbi:MAG: hypothetical protein ABSH20_07735 [Tepidisphaeraceae bacterium]|jgi:hypothetical protein
MSAERDLRVFLRVTGTISMLAIIAVFMPRSMMDAANRALGLGAIPAPPVFEYLARSESALYAMMGAMLWVLSFDIRRHRPVIVAYAGFYVFFGLTIFGIDWRIGLPTWWIAIEGPTVVILGMATLVLLRRVESAGTP